MWTYIFYNLFPGRFLRAIVIYQLLLILLIFFKDGQSQYHQYMLLNDTPNFDTNILESDLLQDKIVKLTESRLMGHRIL